MERLGNRIAFLATGDEIVNGDILDTNAPHFAQLLIDNNFVPGTRLIVSDQQKEMESAIRYLLQDHAALITMGGLGPTSDDRTRFALSDAINEPLEFDESSWQRIVEKLSAYKLDIPENNRQQCLFPKTAEIYPNPYGTASGCCIPYNGKLIFMIPGPPNECRPMFDRYILPRLLKTDLQETIHRCSWMLLGVSEGKVAKGLDGLVEGSDCDIGYRVTYPYLEVKLQSTNKKAFDSMAAKIEAAIQDDLVGPGKATASQLFLQLIQEYKESFSIVDEATQGRLATKLMWPDLSNKLFFNEKKADFQIQLQGLSEYWQKKDVAKTQMSLIVKKGEKVILDQMISVPMREKRTPDYAVELVCYALFRNLKIRLIYN